MPIRTTHLRRVMAVLVLLLTAGTVALRAGEELRTWTDDSGVFKLEAKFIAQDKGKVTLEGKDGKRFEIDIAKLSAADQKHLAELAKKKGPEDPFKQVNAGKPDWSGTRQVDMIAPSSEWKITAKPAPELTAKSAPVALPARQNFFEGCGSFVVNPLSRRALVGYQWTFSAPKANSRLLFCDLDNGKVLAEVKLDGLVTPLAIDDDGSQVLLKRTADKKDVLELWSLTAQGNEKALEFSPADTKGRGHDIHWARFLDKKRLLTSSYGSGMVVMWELPALKPIYQATVQGSSAPALSHDRKLLAFTTGQQLGVLDVDTGKVLALRPASWTPWAELSFSPGGKWLACRAHNRLFVWELATGELHRDFTVSPVDFGNITWPNDKVMLVGNKSLFDLDLGYRFWEYTGHNHVQIYGTQGWFVTHDNQGGALTPAAVPSAEVQAAFEKAGPDIVFKTGTVVKLDVSALPDVAERAKVAKALEELLVKKGCKVGADGTIELVATADVGKEIDLSFVPAEAGGRRPGAPFMRRPGPREPAPKLPPGTKVRQVKLEVHHARLKFIIQGKTVWETSADNVPKSVKLEEGETLDQHMKKLERPNYAFYPTVELPTVLHRDKGVGPVGTSQFSVSGVR